MTPPGYMTVYDFRELSPVDIWLPVAFGVFAIIFAAALWFKRESMMPNRSDGGRLVIAALTIWLSVGWMGLATYRVTTQDLEIKRALRDNTAQAAEGYVTHFKAHFANGDFKEKFCVASVPAKCFSYFDYLPGPAFHRSGLVEQNMPVRVLYVGNNIIKLDIVPQPKQAAPVQPPPLAGTE